MKKYISIKAVRHVNKYKLEIEFSDKKKTTVDFERFLKHSTHPDVVKYLNVKLFKKFKLENGDLMWGDFDLLFPIKDLYRGEIEMVGKKTKDVA